MHNTNTAKVWWTVIWTESCRWWQQFSSWWTDLLCCQSFHSVNWTQLVWVIACGCLIKVVTAVWRHKRRWQYEMLRGCPLSTDVMCDFTMPNVPLRMSAEHPQHIWHYPQPTTLLLSTHSLSCSPFTPNFKVRVWFPMRLHALMLRKGSWNKII